MIGAKKIWKFTRRKPRLMRSGESKGLSIDLGIGVVLEVLKISLEVFVEDNHLRSQGLGVVATGRAVPLLAAQISAPPQQVGGEAPRRSARRNEIGDNSTAAHGWLAFLFGINDDFRRGFCWEKHERENSFSCEKSFWGFL